jgi:hypothetical protein
VVSSGLWGDPTSPVQAGYSIALSFSYYGRICELAGVAAATGVTCGLGSNVEEDRHGSTTAAAASPRIVRHLR